MMMVQGVDGLGVPEPRRENNSWAWDEYPNGRLGDVRSPAYGELDGWGVSLKLSPQEALQAWGRPMHAKDISTLFSKYLDGSLPVLPWCDEPLYQETSSITPFLSKLIATKGWWTVGSQPAVDGVRSDDATYGFGPKGGYIYQKSFVEFWATREDVVRLAQRVNQLEEEQGCRDVTFYASAHPKYEKSAGWLTNMDKGDANAVTWGVFAGKEVVTPTLIEEVSFKAWRVSPVQSTLPSCDLFVELIRVEKKKIQDEAFEIWGEWSRLYPASSASRQLLESVMEDRWLVSMVHHDYKRPAALWEFLLS